MMNPERGGVDVIIYLRWALLLALSYLVLYDRGETAVEPEALAYVAVLLGSNVFFTGLWTAARRDRCLRVLPLVDGVLVVWGLVAFGASQQELIVAYFLCIVVAAFGDSEERTAGAAFLVTAVYAMWLFAGRSHVAGESSLLRLPFLFITTVFYAHVMQRIRTERRSRRRAEARARTLDLLHEITRFFSSSLVSHELLERVSETTRTLLAADRCRILSSAQGDAEPLVAEALRRAEPMRGSRLGEDGVTNLLVLPMLHELETLGVILVERNESRGELRDDDIRLCQLVANAAALALKNAERAERLLDLQQKYSQMVRALSHEVRTPLQMLVGQVQFANEQSHELDDRELRIVVRNVEKAATEFGEHIDELLRQSVVSADRERRQLGKVDLPVLLERSIELVKQLGTSPLEFSLDVAPEVTEIYADPEKLQRVVHHVLLNAMKLARGGALRISASIARETSPTQGLERFREKLLALSVEDLTAGESPDATTAEAGESDTPGFDLAASLRELVDMLDGKIRFELRPGGLAVFRILVPVESPES